MVKTEEEEAVMGQTFSPRGGCKRRPPGCGAVGGNGDAV